MRLSVFVSLAFGLSVTSVFAAPSSWERATQLYESGNYSAAASELNRMSSANPSVHYLLGLCYKRMGKIPEAKRELNWVASYATDANTKELAQNALGQLRSPGGASGSSAAVSRGGSGAPAKVLINDSVSQTIQAAAKSGWRPCPGKCLNVNTPGWHHEHVDGHSDSENWHTFAGTGNPRACTTGHWGQIFEESSDGPPIDKGQCSVCGGTGWVRAN